MIDSYKRYTHKAQYYETDQMGIIHHSNYIRWFEESRIDLLEQIGFGYKKMEEVGISSPVLEVKCEFKSMVRFWDTVYIIPRIELFTGVKLTISYKVMDAVSGELRAVGETRHCFLDTRGVPVSLKKKNEEIYSIIQACIGVYL